MSPSEHRILYSEHFADSCFQPDFAIAASIGLQKRRMPKPDAVPTLFERPAVQLPSSSAGALILAKEAQVLNLLPIMMPQASQRRGGEEVREIKSKHL